MDDITRAFKIAKAHFNDSPVLSQYYLRWSKEMPIKSYGDSLGWRLRLGHALDGHVVAACPERARKLIEHGTTIMWRRE